MPRRIPIRAKLACALAVPLVGLVAGAGYLVTDAERVADEARAETELAAAAVGPGSLVSQLQNERNYSSVDIIGMADTVRLPVGSLDEARAATDGAFARLRQFVADRGPEAQAAFADGLAAVETGLAAVRAEVDRFDGPRTLVSNEMGDRVFEAYAEIIEPLLDGTAGIALRIDDASLRTGVELVDLSTRLYEVRSQVLRQSIAAVLAGFVDQPVRLEVAGMLAEVEALEEAIVQRGIPPYDGFVDNALNDAFVVAQETMLRDFATSGELDVRDVLNTVDTGPDRGVLLVRRQATERLLEEADRVLGAADQQRRNAIVLGGGLVAAALALTVLVSRSITRPLSSLMEQAEVMASETLPAAVKSVLETPLGDDVAIPHVSPVDVQTRDEVREVAAALNVVQANALELAVEQAVLRRNIADSFVNMGRRNQNLLDRQLDFITELEREEQDPDRLSHLFRLDHLATRMRRNAESLLRLAGSEPQRSMSAPIEINDVVRVALGEVEDYQRVQVRGLDPVAVSGGVGADLAHALAELIENALAFSPPSEPVEVRGRRTSSGYLIAVSDAGLGMTPDELVVANRRLAGEEAFTVAPSRYLGHYVAGHLASRLGVRIELQPGPAGGLVARVDVPASLLLDGVRPDEPVEPVREEPVLEDDPELAPVADGVWTAADLAFVDAAEPVAAAEPVTTSPFVSPFSPPPAPPPEWAPAAEPSVVGTTASGLVRRVPGAQRPVTEIGARLASGTADDATDGHMTPDAVSSFLSDFSAGVSRGIAEAGRNPWEEGHEPR